MDEDYEEIAYLARKMSHSPPPSYWALFMEHDGWPVPWTSSGMVVEQFMREGMTEVRRSRRWTYVNHGVTEGGPKILLDSPA